MVAPESIGHGPSSVVELHIEELVLHGFAPGDRHAIGEEVTPGARLHAIGVPMARAVYQGLSR
jgi:hypothetical protein